MNTRNLKLFVLLLLMAAAAPARAQNALVVQQLINFPDLPNDTIYEGQLYNFDIVVFNGTNGVVTGTLQIMMEVDTTTSTLGNPSVAVTLNPGDTAVVSIVGETFGQANLKSGNNIVVVWPAVNSGITYPVDSLTTDVYFVPLNSTGLPVAEPSSFQLFPNPAHDQLNWKSADGKLPERVRIFDTQGQLVMESGPAGSCSVAGWPEGIYFVELQYGDRRVTERFIRW